MSINLHTATHSDFEPLVGQMFSLQLEGKSVDLILENVSLQKEAWMRDNRLEIEGVHYPARRPFSLIFNGPREPVLESIVHTFSNSTIGEIDLFLSQFRQDMDASFYESVFS